MHTPPELLASDILAQRPHPGFGDLAGEPENPWDAFRAISSSDATILSLEDLTVAEGLLTSGLCQAALGSYAKGPDQDVLEFAGSLLATRMELIRREIGGVAPDWCSTYRWIVIEEWRAIARGIDPELFGAVGSLAVTPHEAKTVTLPTEEQLDAYFGTHSPCSVDRDSWRTGSGTDHNSL